MRYSYNRRTCSPEFLIDFMDPRIGGECDARGRFTRAAVQLKPYLNSPTTAVKTKWNAVSIPLVLLSRGND